MFPIERRGLAAIETTGLCIFRIIKPKSHVESIGRLQDGCRWCCRIAGRLRCDSISIKTKNLVEQDRLDDNLGVAVVVGVKVRLVPSQSKAFKAAHGRPVIVERTTLNGKQVKVQIGFQPLDDDKGSIIQVTAFYRHGGARCLATWAEAGKEGRIGMQFERRLLRFILGYR